MTANPFGVRAPRLPWLALLGVSAAAAAILSASAADAIPRPVGQVRGAATSPFVKAQGTQLVLNGHPWQFVGFNDYQLTSEPNGWTCGGALSDTELAQVLDQIKNESASAVVRTWFFQSYWSPGNWSAFDRVLNAAAARGLKVIPTLGNQWGDCEPWLNGVRPYKTRTWYTSGYLQPDYGYNLSYRDYVAAMAAHYASNTTIAFWQLMNEAEAAEDTSATCWQLQASDALRSFSDDMTSVVKAADPNHMVNLGTMGLGQCGTAGSSQYKNIYGGRLDLCEVHDYGPGALSGNQWDGMAVRIEDCKALGKPIFVGEAGIDASVQPDWTSSGTVTPQTLQQRADFFDQKMTAEFGLGYSGFLIWEVNRWYSAADEVGPGDPTAPVMARRQHALDVANNPLGSMQITPGDPISSLTAAPPADAAATNPAPVGSADGAGGNGPTRPRPDGSVWTPPALWAMTGWHPATTTHAAFRWSHPLR
jgi:mannan endo-1,4-beta-mannosidase